MDARRTAVLLPRNARHVWPAKPADQTLDFAVDWTARLGDDALTQSTFLLPPGLSADRADNKLVVATVVLSGGVAGQAYEIENRVKTRAGRVLSQNIKLRVV